MSAAKVLIVEDEQIIARNLEQILKSKDYSVVNIASSGEKSLVQIEETKPDLILIDILLSGKMDGITTINKIKSQYDIPFIFITAHSDEKTLARVKMTEPYGYILKPINKNELYAAIEIALYKHEMEKKLKESEQRYSEAEIALKISEEKYRSIVETTNEAILVLDLDNNFTFVNEAVQPITGYSQDEIKQMKAIDFIHPDDLNSFHDNINNILDGETISSFEFRFKIKNGTYLDIVASGSLMHDAQGQIDSVLLITRDITSRKQSEEDILRASKIESLSLFAGGIAHDFNNLLTPIIGNISLAMLNLSEDDDYYQILSEAEKASLRAKSLTEHLLAFAKGGDPIKKTVSIQDIIKNNSEFALSGSSIKCEFSFSNALWNAELDRGQIGQVIHNLILNARQAMPDGGTITVSAENITLVENSKLPLRKGNYIHITIRDQGIGIQKKNLRNIFDPYFTTREKGSGLGLSVSYSIIKKHDGHIMVQSELGVGTTFLIFLPATSGQLFNDKGKSDEELFSGGKILIMDDEEMVLEVCERMLNLLGFEVTRSQHGQEAIDLYIEAKNSNYPFQLVIMDLTIPGGIGGKDAIKNLREIDPDVKAIVSSGYSNDPVMANYKEYGFNGIVVKPYQIKDLSKSIYDVLQQQV